MKQIIRPFILMVLLLSVNKTFAQSVQPTKGNTQDARQVASTQISAQQMQQRKTEVADRTAKSLQTKLSLTQEQTNKVYEANLKYGNEIDGHNSANVLTKATHDKYVAERNASIKNALTPAQYSQYETMKKTN